MSTRPTFKWTGNKFEKKLVMEDYIAPVENVQIKLNVPPENIASVKRLNGLAFTVRKNSTSVEIVLPKVAL